MTIATDAIASAGPALVTGATGFTGQHLVRRLRAAGIPVRALVRSIERARRTLPADVAIIVGDVTDREALRAAAQGIGTVFHLAAAFREPGIPDRRYHEVHVDATRMLLEEARAAGVRGVVHCSTVGVHAHVDDPPGDETLPYRPHDVYQSTKAEGERLALELGPELGLPVAVIRPTTIYGPGDDRLLKLFRLVASRRFVMLGDGTPYLHLGHVADIVDGLLLAAVTPEAAGEAIIVGGPEYRTLRDTVAFIADTLGVPPPRLRFPVRPVQLAGSLCEAICRPLGIEPPLFRRRVDFFVNSRAFSLAKARRILGFEPRIGLAAGIRETAAWYHQEGLLRVGPLERRLRPRTSVMPASPQALQT